MKQAFSHTPALAERSSVPSTNPYRVIEPIRALRKELGLTPNDLVTLQALISFMPKKAGQTAPITIVFPSNAILSERTNGLNERTIRRCIEHLVVAGLIQRRDSATRKRFPLRYGGVIKDAFGFDLQPMYDRDGELTERAEQLMGDREELRSLKAEALALRVEALRKAKDVETLSFLQHVRNILRRTTLKADEIKDLIMKLAKLAGATIREFPTGNHDVQETMPDQMSGGDGQNVRHVEPTRLNIKKDRADVQCTSDFQKHRDPTIMAWTDLKNISDFFPHEPRDHQSVLEILANVGKLLRIERGRIMKHLTERGPGQLLIALDELILRASTGRVKNNNAYLDAMMRQGN
ncbi:helix-turn-helix domain-containing protein [Loktanella sp. R86503]|uniref:helix-turn-helix domain-containing protein n=1 Tax=Loktanella sp. R86503 TaxID=3093847 RepID=UPI0036D827C7